MFASKMAQVAIRLTNKYGNNATLKEPTGSSYNPATGLTEATYTDHSVKVSTNSDILKRYPAETVQLGDVVVLLHSELNITREWMVNYDGKNWKILDIKTVSAQDTDIIKYLHLRS